MDYTFEKRIAKYGDGSVCIPWPKWLREQLGIALPTEESPGPPFSAKVKRENGEITMTVVLTEPKQN